MTTTSKLITLPIGNCRNIPELLKIKYEGLIKLEPVIFLPSRSLCKPWDRVPTGFVGLVRKSGKYMGVWHSGLHLCINPSIKITHLVSNRPIIFEIKQEKFRTQDNVVVKIDVSITFHINIDWEDNFETKLYNFCYGVQGDAHVDFGAEQLEQILCIKQKEVIGDTINKVKYSEIKSNLILDPDYKYQMELECKEILNKYYTENKYCPVITSLILTNIQTEYVPDSLPKYSETLPKYSETLPKYSETL
jgi:hypothetical protein